MDADVQLNGVVVAAADISFYYEGAEIQPKAAVEVSYASTAAATVIDPTVIHIADDDAIDVMEDVEAETLEAEEAPMAAMSGFGAEENAASTEMVKLSFQTQSFSGYAILGTARKAAAEPVQITTTETTGTENKSADPLTAEVDGVSVEVYEAPEGAKLLVSQLTEEQSTAAKTAIQTALNTTHALVNFKAVDISFTDAADGAEHHPCPCELQGGGHLLHGCGRHGPYP